MKTIYIKELDKVLLEEITWMHDLTKDHILKEIMYTEQQFIDTDRFDWMEATDSGC